MLAFCFCGHHALRALRLARWVDALPAAAIHRSDQLFDVPRSSGRSDSCRNVRSWSESCIPSTGYHHPLCIGFMALDGATSAGIQPEESSVGVERLEELSRGRKRDLTIKQSLVYYRWRTFLLRDVGGYGQSEGALQAAEEPLQFRAHIRPVPVSLRLIDNA